MPVTPRTWTRSKIVAVDDIPEWRQQRREQYFLARHIERRETWAYWSGFLTGVAITAMIGAALFAMARRWVL